MWIRNKFVSFNVLLSTSKNMCDNIHFINVYILKYLLLENESPGGILAIWYSAFRKYWSVLIYWLKNLMETESLKPYFMESKAHFPLLTLFLIVLQYKHRNRNNCSKCCPCVQLIIFNSISKAQNQLSVKTVFLIYLSFSLFVSKKKKWSVLYFTPGKWFHLSPEHFVARQCWE